MSKITLRSPYETWRGKDQAEGGNVLYPLAGRMFARPNAVPENPNSPLQFFTRNTLAAVSQAFSNLTPAQLLDWETKAQDFIRTDSDGETYQPGAKGYFVSVNWYRALAGQPITTTAPFVSGPVTVISTPALFLDGDENQFQFTSSAAVGAVIVEASGPLPGAVRKAIDSDYRLINVAVPTANVQNAAAGLMSFTVPAAARHYIYQQGNRVGLRLNLLTAGYVQQNAYEFEVIATEL